MPDAPIASLPDLADVATAVLEESGLDTLDPATAVGVLPSTLPAVPAQTTAAEPVPVGAVAAPPPAPAAETPVEAPPAAIPTPDAPPSGTVSQTAPGNVNVSVRVDSPGDDGTVEQVNAAVAEPAAQYQPEPTQYQEPIPAPDAQQAAPTAQPAASESAAEADGSTWTWEWDCGDAAPNIAVPADVGVENWTWNWNWNCGEPDSATANSAGEKPPQYQPAVTQYRPININISIRINSPGNNGPVLQTNVAVAVTPPALPQFRVESVNRSVNQPQTASAAAEASTPLGALIAVFDELLVDDPEAVPAEDGCCPLREAHGPATAAPEPESMLLPEAPPAAERDLTPQGRFRASVAVTMRLARASEALARSARPAPKPAQLRPAPHTSAPAHERAAALSAAGLAPLNAPDSRFGQIVFLVAAFAFAIAFADASRPVAAEVRARGEDPDPPPTRPG
jgi:hypothetical protein